MVFSNTSQSILLGFYPDEGKVYLQVGYLVALAFTAGSVLMTALVSARTTRDSTRQRKTLPQLRTNR